MCIDERTINLLKTKKQVTTELKSKSQYQSVMNLPPFVALKYKYL
jgi:hypothetical protein